MVSLMALKMLMIVMTDETKSVSFKRVSRNGGNDIRLHSFNNVCYVERLFWLIRTKHLIEGVICVIL